MSEEMLIHYCAPTLAGIKTGNLFTCPYQSKAQIQAEICAFHQRLAAKGLRILPLQYAQDHVLIYVFRPAELAADLSREEARELLKEAGYQNQTPGSCILELIHRLKATECFPHEIGLFLSYPPEDVRGFIENKARNFKLIGCWKVYGDAEKSKRTFDRYKRCTDIYLARWSKGMKVEQLTVAG